MQDSRADTQSREEFRRTEGENFRFLSNPIACYENVCQVRLRALGSVLLRPNVIVQIILGMPAAVLLLQRINKTVLYISRVPLPPSSNLQISHTKITISKQSPNNLHRPCRWTSFVFRESVSAELSLRCGSFESLLVMKYSNCVFPSAVQQAYCKSSI